MHRHCSGRAQGRSGKPSLLIKSLLVRHRDPVLGPPSLSFRISGQIDSRTSFKYPAADGDPLKDMAPIPDLLELTQNKVHLAKYRQELSSGIASHTMTATLGVQQQERWTREEPILGKTSRAGSTSRDIVRS
jgi:hypothetical protein